MYPASNFNLSIQLGDFYLSIYVTHMKINVAIYPSISSILYIFISTLMPVPVPGDSSHVCRENYVMSCFHQGLGEAAKKNSFLMAMPIWKKGSTAI